MPQSSSFVAGHFGKRGAGKSYKAMRYLAEHRPGRLLIWDTMGEYGAHAHAVPTLAHIGELTKGERFALRYTPRGTDRELAARFGAFCALAYQRGNLLMVVEELQRVTEPSHAPADWSDCTLRGRHRGVSIIGLSQRPASVDKDFFSMCDLITTARLAYSRDRRTMAEELDVPLADVMALRGYDWIGRTGEGERVGELKREKKPARGRAALKAV